MFAVPTSDAGTSYTATTMHMADGVVMGGVSVAPATGGMSVSVASSIATAVTASSGGYEASAGSGGGMDLDGARHREGSGSIDNGSSSRVSSPSGRGRRGRGRGRGSVGRTTRSRSGRATRAASSSSEAAAVGAGGAVDSNGAAAGVERDGAASGHSHSLRGAAGAQDAHATVAAPVGGRARGGQARALPSAKPQAKQKAAGAPGRPATGSGAPGRRRGSAPPRRPGPQYEFAGKFQAYRKRVAATLSKVRYLKTLLDAYASNGWQDAKRESVKPKSEIFKARTALRRAKRLLRNALLELWDEDRDDEPAVTAELLRNDATGRELVNMEDMGCSRCHRLEADDDNDILLCDHAGCNRAYHQNCMEPPFPTECIPQEELDPWFCNRCRCFLMCLEDVNLAFGTNMNPPKDTLFPELDDEDDEDELTLIDGVPLKEPALGDIRAGSEDDDAVLEPGHAESVPHGSPTRRRTAAVDYAKLNKLMFPPTEKESEEESSDDENDEDWSSAAKTKTRSKKKRPREHDGGRGRAAPGAVSTQHSAGGAGAGASAQAHVVAGADLAVASEQLTTTAVVAPAIGASHSGGFVGGDGGQPPAKQGRFEA